MGDAFFEAEEFYGMKSDTYMYKALRDVLKREGISLGTQYKNRPEDSDVVICLNETLFFVNYKRSSKNKKLILILTEPPVYNAKDWTVERHVYFDLVLSYDKDLLHRSQNKYHFIHFPIEFQKTTTYVLPSESEFHSKKLVSMVAGAFTITKAPREYNSLLYERYKILKFYNRNYPNLLDFFSRNPPVEKFKHFRGAKIFYTLHEALPRWIGKVLYKSQISSVYRGAIPGTQKQAVLSQYKFNFCLENTHGIKGLISEKIFDCFEAGTVPIYFGAPDIKEHIPENCFIDYGLFTSLKELHVHLKEMNYKTYLCYLKNAHTFLNKGARPFSADEFVNKVCALIKV
jgi:hypothetical protein